MGIVFAGDEAADWSAIFAGTFGGERGCSSMACLAMNGADGMDAR